MAVTPVSSLPIVQLTDAADANAASAALTTALDHIVIPKYASSAARDAANPSPTSDDLCSIGNAGFYYYDGSAWQPWGTPLRGSRTTSLSIGTSLTTYATVPESLSTGTYHFHAMMAINQTGSAVCSAQVAFSGTATPIAYQTYIWNTTADTFNASSAIVTSFASNQSTGATIAHYIFEFEGLFVVTVAGSLSIGGTCATTARTADAGGFIVCEKWA